MQPGAGQVIIEAAGLPALFDALHARGYTVVGPMVRDGAIVVSELASASDLRMAGAWTPRPAGIGCAPVTTRPPSATPRVHSRGRASCTRRAPGCGRQTRVNGTVVVTEPGGAVCVARGAPARPCRDRRPGPVPGRRRAYRLDLLRRPRRQPGHRRGVHRAGRHLLLHLMVAVAEALCAAAIWVRGAVVSNAAAEVNVGLIGVRAAAVL